MTPPVRDIVEEVRSLVAQGQFRISEHALERMEERRVTESDIREAADMAHDCYEQENGNVAIVGPDLDGEDFKVVAGIDVDGVVVVTVHDA